MNGQLIPIGVDLSEVAQKRHEMVVNSIQRLQYFAYRAKFVKGLTNEDVVVVCIKVDTDWRPIVDVLLEKPSDGRYKCIALDESGCTVYEIEPIEQKMQ